jgi:hypothetical protein
MCVPDEENNFDCCMELSWFDISIFCSNKQRGIIAMEMGAPGERAFNFLIMPTACRSAKQ